jgi:hypothetical protein
MDEICGNDAFVMQGETVEIERGQRYRILWKDNSIYEGVYLGYCDVHPWCHSICMRNVTQIIEGQGVFNYEDMFIALEKSGVRRIEKVEHDLTAMLKIIEPDSQDFNFSERQN